MYLPDEIPDAHVLITVKTYPLPSNKYNELVCTAGFTSDGKWIRLYPIRFRAIPYEQQFSKYRWISADLIRNTSDFRPESYRLKRDVDDISLGEKIGTQDAWAERKGYVLKEVFTSMDDLVNRAKGDERKSLGTLQPKEIIEFVIEPDDREWKPEWRDQLRQFNLFDLDEKGEGKKRSVVHKIPYKYSYKLLSQGDQRPRKMMIEDWELGALYWNCLKQCNGDEDEANRLVRKKYFDEFLKKDLYLFLGTTKQFHLVSPQPFIIIGVFYPPMPKETSKVPAVQSVQPVENVQQLSLFGD